MSTPTEEEKKWLEAWKNADKALNELRVKELQNFDYEAKRDIVHGLLQLGYRFRRPKEMSGLVEMQRLFRKARK